MASVVLNCSVRWEEIGPDGSQCSGCGDLCLLNQWVPVFYIERRRQGVIEGYELCDSCHEVVTEDDDAGEEWKH